MTDYIIVAAPASDPPRTWLGEHGVPAIAYGYTMEEVAFGYDCQDDAGYIRDEIREAYPQAGGITIIVPGRHRENALQTGVVRRALPLRRKLPRISRIAASEGA